MSVLPGNLSLNGTSLFIESHGSTDKPSEHRTWNVFLFCLTFTIAFPALLGSIYSLVSLLKMQNKTTVSMIVTSLAIDDLITVVPVILFMLTQWSSEALPQPLCTTSALMYLFQGISSNLKGSLIVSYNFYTMSTTEILSYSSSERRVSVVWAILTIWIVSLLICILPLCGWGGYIPTSWGCFTDCASSYTLFVSIAYSLCCCLLTVLAVPLTYQLLCSGEPQLLHSEYLEVSGGFNTPGTPAGCAAPSLSPLDPGDKTLEHSPNSEAVFGKGVAESGTLMSSTQSRSFMVGFAQKRFSLILALTKVVLWLPMMIQMVVQYFTGLQSLWLETLSFPLTLLAVTVTPVFVLSEHWVHLPCGCVINCRRNSCAVSSEDLETKRRGFEFNLSFQQGYGIYRISQENHHRHHNGDGKSTSCHNLVSCAGDELEPGRGRSDAPSPGRSLIPLTALAHSSPPGGPMAGLDPPQHPPAGLGASRGEQGTACDPSVFPEGPEWRLSHEESHKPELTDWEWCRSKSERTPRQRSGGALAIPLWAFQGTVSLQAPTGKTFSLSTYEVSSEGQKITPTAKKIEVYLSNSVGHEPNPEESPNTFADTSVKIHLEVLEICDNEEALDTVSIISNISQSSAQARSPSLRYSRKENRFVSCDLGESASYSLLIPSNNPGSDISISIPDTVEAHRQNSRKQHLDRDGYQEEIQLLNKAYREREEGGDSS
ncbi:PREDICTED: probable G-protein coupled receptor 149 [Acanthisitta chloris]|uniref:Putative G-protein coupled receptor 149 n=1 Tax=Acanthisitta chloris TaxID=57068 RepID=A0A091N5B6_9PASS|nr:PREDICTED: probable G-protein coupled receptor 149 [Acanthisitta chloris]KFP85008.1 putative G-protein coupled receptor 149 [Acanthisitta chloris]